MQVIGGALRRLGANGPFLLVGSVAAGLIFEPLTSLAEKVLPLAAFLLTLGSFLCAALSPRERLAEGSALGFALLFAGLCMPLLTYVYIIVVTVDPKIELAVMVAAMAPPVGSAAAIAAMLGLQPRLALAVSMMLTLAAPIIMPVSIQVFGLGVAVDFSHVFLRLLAIVGGAGLVTLIFMRWRRQTSWLVPDALAGSGVSVIGLTIVGLAVTSGVTPLAATPMRLLALLALALVLNFGGVLLGAIAFTACGRRVALTVGIVSGNRNVTLAWAAAGSSLPQEAQSYLALCVVPVLSLPLILKAFVALARPVQPATEEVR